MIPPLRERLSEIAPLAIGFLRQAVAAAGCGPLGLSDDAMAALHAYHWPGNVRELEHLLQSLAIVTRDAWIRREHLPDFLFAASSADDERSHSTPATFEHEASLSASSRSFTAQSAAFMRQRLLEALGKHSGNKTRAAAELGMPRTTLVAKLKQLGVVAGAPLNAQRRTGA